MSVHLKYFLGCLLGIPLLPIMYVQGKNIRKTVPRLPEAKGTSGIVKNQSNETLNVLILGESTMAGVGAETHDKAFSGFFAKELSRLTQTKVKWRVYARGGYTVKRLIYKILPKIEEAKSDLVLIGMGGNDAFKLNSPKTWRKDLTLLIEACQDKFPDTPIVFANMPPIKEFPAFSKTIKFVVGNLVELFGEVLKELSQKYEQVYYSSEIIQLDSWINKFDKQYTVKDFFSDGVHPSKLTYNVWADDAAAFVHRKIKF